MILKEEKFGSPAALVEIDDEADLVGLVRMQLVEVAEVLFDLIANGVVDGHDGLEGLDLDDKARTDQIGPAGAEKMPLVEDGHGGLRDGGRVLGQELPVHGVPVNGLRVPHAQIVHDLSGDGLDKAHVHRGWVDRMRANILLWGWADVGGRAFKKPTSILEGGNLDVLGEIIPGGHIDNILQGHLDADAGALVIDGMEEEHKERHEKD